MKLPIEHIVRYSSTTNKKGEFELFIADVEKCNLLHLFLHFLHVHFFSCTFVIHLPRKKIEEKEMSTFIRDIEYLYTSLGNEFNNLFIFFSFFHTYIKVDYICISILR